MKKKLFDTKKPTHKGTSDWNINKVNKKEVAIIGIGVKLPGCETLQDYWKLILQSEDMIGEFPEPRKEQLNKLLPLPGQSVIEKESSFCKGAFLEGISQFDHGKYKLSKTEAALMSPAQRLFLQTAYQAIENAGYGIEAIQGTNTGVFVGYSSYGLKYANLLYDIKPEFKPLALPGNLDAVIPSRISYLLDLKGPSLLTDTACSSSLVSVYQAYESIVNGTSEMALAGGVRIMLNPREQAENEKVGIESNDGKTRTFDSMASGTGIGEGVLCILMKPLHKALQDKDPVYAVVKGGAMNQDGKSIGLTAPNGKAQQEVLKKAWINAEINPEHLQYIEVHGTGTELGDPIEVQGLTEAFAEFSDNKQFCAVSSVKTNIGHLDCAAGIAGLIKACLALKYQTLPGQNHYDFPNEKINFIDSPLYVNVKAKKWEKNKNNRLCGVSSFGLSGTNCHMVLEEAPVTDVQLHRHEVYFLVLSSYSKEGLHEVLKRTEDSLSEDPGSDLYSFMYYAATAKTFREQRLVLISKDESSMLSLLRRFTDSTPDQLPLNKIMTEEGLSFAILKQDGTLGTSLADKLESFIHGEYIDFKSEFSLSKVKPIHIPAFPDKPIECWPSAEEMQNSNKIDKEKNHHQPVFNSMAMLETNHTAKNQASEQLKEQISRFIQKIFDLDYIDPSESFFDLGFDSISIIQLQQHIKSSYALEVSLNSLYQELNTINDLTAFILKESSVIQYSEEPPVPQPKADSQPSVQAAESALEVTKPSGSSQNMHHPLLKELLDKQLEVLNEQLQLLSSVMGDVGKNEVSSQTKPAQETLNKSVATTKGGNHYKPFKEITNQTIELSDVQQKYIQAFKEEYISNTISSKEFVAKGRDSWANHRNVSIYNHSWKELIYPIMADKAQGAYMWDLDGNKYVDFSMGFGVHLLGYNHDFWNETIQNYGSEKNFLGPISTDALETAELIKDLAKVERVAFYNSGTEAVMIALRMARGASDKRKVVLFAGSYHGTFDGVLADQQEDFSAAPLSPGTMPGMLEDVVVLNYGTKESIDYIQENIDELAAVLVEPVQSRRADFHPKEYLQQIREITQQAEVALIFDEVITGFRIAPGGAQEYFGIQADIVTYGKVVGGGMPIGVVAGKAKYMDMIDGGSWNYGDDSYPAARRVTVAGTFCHHPLTMKLTSRMLRYFKEQGAELQNRLNRKASFLVNKLNEFFEVNQLPLSAFNFGSMFSIKPKQNLELLGLLHYHLLLNRVYLWEGATCFISEAHTYDDLMYFVKAVKESFYRLIDSDFLPEQIVDKLRKYKQQYGQDNYQLPLSIEQKQMVARLLMDSKSATAFNETTIVDVNFPLNKAVLADTIHLLAHRHEVLRVSKIDQENQTIEASASIEVVYDQIKSSGGKFDSIEKWVQANLSQPFNLAKGPFLRCHVLQKDEQGFILQLVAHHIVVDGWSMNVLLKELNTIYQHYLGNQNLRLAPAAPFSQYIDWINGQLKEDKLEEHLNFWKSQFDVDIPEFNVALIPCEQADNAKEEVVYAKLDKEFSTQLKDWSKQNQVSLFSTLLGAYQFLQHILSGNATVRTGVPYAGQLSSGIYNLVGQCVKVLPFITSVKAENSPVDLVKNLMEISLNIHKHQIVPVEQLLQQNETVQKNTLINDTIVFNLDQPIKKERQEQESINLARTNKYDLFFDAIEVGGKINLRVEFNSEKFSKSTIEEWVELYQNILEYFVKSENAPLNKIQL
jgi:iturin family lipopeptide synthetase A